MSLNFPCYFFKHFGSKKGLLKHIYFKIRYWLGDRFNTTKVSGAQIDRIVYVCKGNICRSAFAEGVSKDKVSVPVASLGLDTQSGHPIDKRICYMASMRNVDLSKHRTTSIVDFEPQLGDLYICMEPEQCFILRSHYPQARITLLGFYGDSIRPYLHDPYCAPDDYVEFCLDYLKQAVDGLITRLEGSVRP